MTDKIQPPANEQWQYGLKELRDLRLLAKKEEENPDTLDCHPLVREYFGAKLKQTNPDAWKQAHSRLYEYYKNLPEKLYGKFLPDTLEEMEPLFAAVAHGCMAGRHQEALYDVFWERIRRKKIAYSIYKLGAFGSELAAVSYFFEVLWTTPAKELGDAEKAYVLDWAAFNLRSSGRLREAVQPMQAAFETVVKQENWINIAIVTGGFSELWLTIGDVPKAVSYARQGIEFADKIWDVILREVNRTLLADALHHANKLSESQCLFAEAEAMQKERQPEYPFLYDIRGFQYCELLLHMGKYGEVRKRSNETIKIAKQYKMIHDIALGNLSLGKTSLLQAQEQGSNDFTQAEAYLHQAVDGFVKSGDTDYYACALLARAALFRAKKEFAKAHADLDEVFEIADRSEMKLYLTDYHLESCRLCLAENKPEDAKKHLAAAKKLITKTGYRRRDKDVEELAGVLAEP